jgi:hypothetical protein
MKLRTYGCGKKFDSSKFNLIENQDFFNKPEGGLWASPVSSKYGWREWCNAENFKTSTLKTFFNFKIKGKILIINYHRDLEKLTWRQVHNSILVIDFKEVSKTWDAIFLTEKGQREVRLTHPKNLYGWDCESVLILNSNIIQT